MAHGAIGRPEPRAHRTDTGDGTLTHPSIMLHPSGSCVVHQPSASSSPRTSSVSPCGLDWTPGVACPSRSSIVHCALSITHHAAQGHSARGAGCPSVGRRSVVCGRWSPAPTPLPELPKPPAWAWLRRRRGYNFRRVVRTKWRGVWHPARWWLGGGPHLEWSERGSQRISGLTGPSRVTHATINPCPTPSTQRRAPNVQRAQRSTSAIQAESAAGWRAAEPQYLWC